MTAEATTYVLTSEDIAHRKACAYLKGIIVGYASSHGMKWNGDPDRTPEFKDGYEKGIKESYFPISAIHVIYNRIRHNRPHRKTVGDDTACLKSTSNYYLKPVFEKLEEYGYDVKGVL